MTDGQTEPAHVAHAHGVTSAPTHIDYRGQRRRQTIEEHPASQGEVIEFAMERLKTDNDIQILITGPTGSGKTSLAVSMAETIEQLAYGERWDAEEAGAVGDFLRFQSIYETREKGQVAMLDELEAVADNRRATSSSNVDLSQMLAQLRYMNVCSIFTAPVTTMIDSRIVSQADIWIQVLFRGFALPHYVVHVDEPENPRWYTRLVHTADGHAQIIEFQDLKWNRNKNELDRMKASGSGLQNVKRYGADDVLKEKSKAKDEARAEVAASMLEKTDLSQYVIADVIDMDQSWVSKLNNGHHSHLDIDYDFPIR